MELTCQELKHLTSSEGEKYSGTIWEKKENRDRYKEENLDKRNKN